MRKLQKSIYCLRQASRNWYQKFSKAIICHGFKESKADHSMFIFWEDFVHAIALIYVNDILLLGNNGEKNKKVSL